MKGGAGGRLKPMFILSFMLLIMLLLVPPAEAKEGKVAQSFSYALPPEVVPANNTVYISLWIVDMYGYDYKEGSYIFDFGVYFSWSDSNYTTIDWYLMNGYPVTPSSKQLIARTELDGITSEVYRVRGIFDVDVIPKYYPFDTVRLPILIEVLTHGYPMELIWVESESGISPDFIEVGWDFQGIEYSTSGEDYPYNVSLPQAEMDLVLKRAMYSAIYSVIVPPIIFCIVSAFSFAFKIEDDNAFGIRIGLNTSMLITAVLFALAEADKIPPMTNFNAYSIFEISVLVFISMNLITTIVGYMAWKYKEDNTFVRTINRLGLAASFLVPILVFVVIYLISAF